MNTFLVAVNTYGNSTYNDIELDLDMSVASRFIPFVEGNHFDPAQTSVGDLLKRVVMQAIADQLGESADQIESFTLHMGE